MAKTKFYGVKKGHTTGVFETWAECEEQIRGFKGAEYKSFKTKEEVLEYLEYTASSDSRITSEEDAKGIKKLYAVRAGKVPGVYPTWEDCKLQTVGFSGAKYESFKTYKDALAYVNGVDVKQDRVRLVTEKAEELSFEEDSMVVYTDGSSGEFFKEDGEMYIRYSGSYLILEKGKEVDHDAFEGKNTEASEERNVAGELLGVMKACLRAVKAGKKKVHIFFDYKGISHWVDGSWTANSQVAKEYIIFMNKIKTNIIIEFHKVEGHAGDPYNDKVDGYARKVLGL